MRRVWSSKKHARNSFKPSIKDPKDRRPEDLLKGHPSASSSDWKLLRSAQYPMAPLQFDHDGGTDAGMEDDLSGSRAVALYYRFENAEPPSHDRSIPDRRSPEAPPPMSLIWSQCMSRLEGELPPQQFNTWIRPLQPVESAGELRLLAPNKFVLDWVKQHFFGRIEEVLAAQNQPAPTVSLEIGSRPVESPTAAKSIAPAQTVPATKAASTRRVLANNLNPSFTFDSFVEGKSNQLARAASLQVAQNVGRAYNPLFIYGGVGLEDAPDACHWG